VAIDAVASDKVEKQLAFQSLVARLEAEGIPFKSIFRDGSKMTFTPEEGCGPIMSNVIAEKQKNLPPHLLLGTPICSGLAEEMATLLNVLLRALKTRLENGRFPECHKIMTEIQSRKIEIDQFREEYGPSTDQLTDEELNALLKEDDVKWGFEDMKYEKIEGVISNDNEDEV